MKLLKRMVPLLIALAPIDCQAVDQLVAEGAKVKKLAGDFGFTEGPAWHGEEQALYFSDLKGKTTHRWSEKDGHAQIRKGEQTSNGIWVDAEGNLVFCEVGGFRIVLRTLAGKETTVVEGIEGKPLGQPNDLWIAPGGGIYFSVPDKSKKIPRLAREGRVMGSVLLIEPDGKVRDVGAAIDIRSPNGVVGSADGKRLYFTDRGKCWVAKIGEDGSLSEKKIAAPKGSDGLTLDEHGNLYTTSKAGVEVFAPDASRLGLIPVPKTPANVCFGGEDGKTLFVTARTGLYSVRMRVRGDAFASSSREGTPR